MEGLYVGVESVAWRVVGDEVERSVGDRLYVVWRLRVGFWLLLSEGEVSEKGNIV